MKKVSILFKVVTILSVLVFAAFLTGCDHESISDPIPSSEPDPVSPAAPDPVSPAAPDPVSPAAPDPVLPSEPVRGPLYNDSVKSIQLSNEELVVYIKDQTWTTSDDPLKVTLKDTTIPDLTELKSEDFSVYFELELPAGLTDIGTSLENLKTLTSVTIPTSVKTISANAFSGCSGLRNLTVPGDMPNLSTYVDENIFKDSPNLTEITFTGKTATGRWNRAVSNSNITKATFDCEDIGCSNYDYQIRRTGSNNIFAFHLCNLIEVDMTDKVKKIGTQAFSSNPYLKKLLFLTVSLLLIGRFLQIVQLLKKSQLEQA